MKKITLIGLGRMGQALGAKILEAGFPLTVYNRTSEKTKELVKLGAQKADTIKLACVDSDIILTSLLDDNSVLDVSSGDNGIIESMKSSAIHVGTSTILPDTAEKIAKIHNEKDKKYLSAAVLGVPKVAFKGELTTFCSGDESDFNECNEILKTFSKAVINFGEKAKDPLIMKICMNYSLVTALELFSELYVFAEKSGLDKEIIQYGLNEIYSHPAFKLYIDKIKNRDFDDVNFDMKGGIKDVTIFQKAFTDAGVTPRIADILKGRYISSLANNMDDKDWSAIYEIVRKESGLK